MGETPVQRTRPHGGPPTAPPQAVLFDVYGTLFDVHCVAGLADELHPGHGRALASAWRLKQVDYTRLCSMSGRYQPFGEVTAAALDAAAAALGIPLSDDERGRLLEAYADLTPYPDCDSVVRQLHATGLPLGVLSNGEPAQLDRLIEGAGWGPLLPHRISTHEARCYKMDPRAYALGPQHLGLEASQILFVSANGWDAMGATWCGLRVFWLNREQVAAEAIGPALGEEGRELADVLRLFR